MYKNLVKPFLDRFTALILMALVLPVLVLIFLLLFICHGSAFFRQARPGKNGQLFTIYKFKTMNDATDSFGNLLPDDQRLTRIGKFVRKTSVDELPQLWNVLIGEMSFVGPRPLLPEYLPLYNEFQKRRHEVLPGITGWAQVNGRNAISWEEKFKMDVWYVNNQSFLLDCKILWKTFRKVLISEGISDGKTATTTNFKGNDT